MNESREAVIPHSVSELTLSRQVNCLWKRGKSCRDFRGNCTGPQL